MDHLPLLQSPEASLGTPAEFSDGSLIVTTPAESSNGLLATPVESSDGLLATPVEPFDGLLANPAESSDGLRANPAESSDKSLATPVAKPEITDGGQKGVSGWLALRRPSNIQEMF